MSDRRSDDGADREGQAESSIGGRYRVIGTLGRGGMARVLDVVDERTGRRVALKSLRVGDANPDAARAMLESEYHTLLELAHPAIVRVMDFGRDGEGAYYTMERLEGQDLRDAPKRGALELSSVCGLLRDTASALSLIHSRRLVHRDVSPRNVWQTPEGRAKLIDFGTLVAMGPQRRVVGTAPYVPPEAMHGQPLDARTDLYALGGLAHYLLTGRDAYPARKLSQLQALWRRPAPRLEVLRPDLPEAFCDLVSALMSLDPRGRPRSGAEVVDRLEAIVELPVEDERPTAQAYLTTPSLVGRGETSARVRRLLTRAQAGRGAALCITGAPGMGRSRMLASLVVEAKLMGALTLDLDANAVGPGRGALSRAILEAVEGAAPQDAANPGGGQAAAPLDALARASRRQLTVLAIDDVHRADDTSLAALSRVATAAPGHALLLATSCDEGALEAGGLLGHLIDASIVLSLPPLTAADTHALLSSVFGPAEGLQDASGWLHELSRGSPEACLQYAQHLVDHDLARYEGGQWRLPPRLREHGLPESLQAMLEQRLRDLSPDAQSVALALCLSFDDTRPTGQPETLVAIEDYPRLLDADAEPARAFAAVGELVRAGLLEQHEGGFALAQPVLVEVLPEQAGAEACRRMHARLADVFARGSYRDVIMAHRQLQRAGEHRRALELLIGGADRASSSQPFDWDQLRIAMSRDTYADALAYWRSHGGTPREGILLRRLLLTVGSVYRWDVGPLGDEQLERLKRDAGLEGLYVAPGDGPGLAELIDRMQQADARHREARPEARGLSPLLAVAELASTSLMLSGAHCNAHDLPRMRTVEELAELLRPLSAPTALLADLVELAARRARGRELGDDLQRAIDRLLEASELPDIVRSGAGFVLGHVQGVEHARRGRIAALEMADRLANSSTVDRWLTWHLRWLGHAFRGEDAQALATYGTVQGATEDDAWRRKAFHFVEAQLHALTGDLLALRGTADELDALAASFEGLSPWADYAHGELHRLRGEIDAAGARLERCLAHALPGEHRAWVLAAPGAAELALARGAPEEALARADAVVAEATRSSLDRSAVVAGLRIRALAQCELSRTEAARESIQQASDEADAIGLDGLCRVPLCEAQASVAIASEDARAYTRALGTIQRLLQDAEAPALHRHHDELRQRGMALLGRALESVPPAARAAPPSTHLAELSSRLSSIGDGRERSEHALRALVEQTGAEGGHLFAVDQGGLLLTASAAGGYPDAGLMKAVEVRLGELGGRDPSRNRDPASTAGADEERRLVAADGTRMLAVSLYDASSAAPAALAILAEPAGRSLSPPSQELVQALESGLFTLEPDRTTRR